MCGSGLAVILMACVEGYESKVMLRRLCIEGFASVEVFSLGAGMELSNYFAQIFAA